MAMPFKSMPGVGIMAALPPVAATVPASLPRKIPPMRLPELESAYTTHGGAEEAMYTKSPGTTPATVTPMLRSIRGGSPFNEPTHLGWLLLTPATVIAILSPTAFVRERLRTGRCHPWLGP